VHDHVHARTRRADAGAIAQIDALNLGAEDP
jgi:hypothetical protein